MRFLLLATLLALTSCAPSRPPQAAPAPDIAIVHDPAAMDAVYGTWRFTARQDEKSVDGTFTLSSDPSENRMVIPVVFMDSGVDSSEVAFDGERLAWHGYSTAMGQARPFSIRAEVQADTMRGTNRIEGEGTYLFVAVR